MPTLRTLAPSFRAPTRNLSSSLEQCQGFTSLCYGFRGPTRNDGGGCDKFGMLPQPHTVIPDEECRHSGRRVPSFRTKSAVIPDEECRHSGRRVPSFRAPTRNPSSSLEQCQGFTSMNLQIRWDCPFGIIHTGCKEKNCYKIIQIEKLLFKEQPFIESHRISGKKLLLFHRLQAILPPEA